MICNRVRCCHAAAILRRRYGTMAGKVIAIDGPAASGKSTCARTLAARLGYHYIDSGALYRAVTWKALREGMDCRDLARIKELLSRLQITFCTVNGVVHWRVDGEDPGTAIRSEQVDQQVSPLAAMPEVRDRVTACLRAAQTLGDVVVEGRDIGTVVFPEATYKFYLTASADVRAQRRHAELLARSHVAHAEEVRKAILTRDRLDSTRFKAPLRKAPDAVEIDTTDLSIRDVVACMLRHIEAAL